MNGGPGRRVEQTYVTQVDRSLLTDTYTYTYSCGHKQTFTGQIVAQGGTPSECSACLTERWMRQHAPGGMIPVSNATHVTLRHEMDRLQNAQLLYGTDEMKKKNAYWTSASYSPNPTAIRHIPAVEWLRDQVNMVRRRAWQTT